MKPLKIERLRLALRALDDIDRLEHILANLALVDVRHLSEVFEGEYFPAECPQDSPYAIIDYGCVSVSVFAEDDYYIDLQDVDVWNSDGEKVFNCNFEKVQEALRISGGLVDQLLFEKYGEEEQ